MAQKYFSLIQGSINKEFASEEMTACITKGKIILGDEEESNYSEDEHNESAAQSMINLAVDNLQHQDGMRVAVRLAERISQLLAITEAP